MTSNSMNGRYLLSVIYDNYQHGEKEYSHLLLRKKQSASITSKHIFVKDESHAFSQTEIINEMKPDPINRRHRCLSSISTIKNSISQRS